MLSPEPMASPALKLPFSLPPPREPGVDLLVVAGEHSGDQQAALAVADLLARRPDARVAAVGGPALEAAGAQLLYDLTGAAVVGLVEVVRHFSFFKTAFEVLLDWIEKYRPRAVCLVDYPGFNLRLAERLRARGLSRKGGGEISVLFYISPQIWAWKSRRRFTMARTLDAMAVIFPFEKECYSDTDLPVDFVGHPFVMEEHPLSLEYAPEAPVLLLPGSRKAAVDRIFPLILNGFARHRVRHPDEQGVVIFPSDPLLNQLHALAARFPEAARGIQFVPQGSPVRAKAVLASSGTMSLRCALAQIPGAIVYRANPITYLLGRVLVKVRYLGINNLLLNEAMYPEYIQGSATPENLARELDDCVTNPARLEQTRHHAERLRQTLSQPGEATAGAWLEKQLS